MPQTSTLSGSGATAGTGALPPARDARATRTSAEGLEAKAAAGVDWEASKQLRRRGWQGSERTFWRARQPR
eukprot:8598567-Alexandrium_andersonii.AAC.1